MSGPVSGVSDSDTAWWNRDIMAAIDAAGGSEGEKVWLTQNLTTIGAATWTDITPVDVDTFERGHLFFGRVKFAPTIENVIYVVGYAEGYHIALLSCWIFRSPDLGATWSYNLVRDDFNALAGDYTVTHEISDVEIWDGDPIQFMQTHARTGDEESTYNPWAIAYRIVTNDTGSWANLDGDGVTIHDFDNSSLLDNVLWGTGNWLLGGGGAAGEAYLDDYFGVGGWTETSGIDQNMPKEEGRIYVKQTFTHSSNSYWAYAESWVFWNVPKIAISYAFDIARNNTVLYIGFLDAIYQSLDAGYNWQDISTEETEGEGAYDICIDPLIYEAIYYWSASLSDTHIFKSPTLGIGSPALESSGLCLRVGGVKTGDALLSSWPSTAVNRIARSWNSGKIWGIHRESNLWYMSMRNLGITTVQLGFPTVLVESTFIKGTTILGRAWAQTIALKYYHQDKLIYVDRKSIYISDDAGETMTAKKGGWISYSFGVVGHRLPEAEA